MLFSTKNSNTNKETAQDISDEVLGPNREIIFYRFSLVVIVVLTPFIVNAMFQGRWVMALPASVIISVLAFNSWKIHRGSKPPIPPVVVFLPMLITILVAIPERGIIGALWTYPAILLAYFILEQRTAKLISVVFIAAVAIIAMEALGMSITLRLAVTLVVTAVFANIFSSAIIKVQSRLKHMANIDPLTGAYNRRHMESCVNEAIKQHEQYKTPASMLMVDIDHFKQINDELGHDAGDQALNNLIAELKFGLRNGDEVFRIGGEEFVLLLPNADINNATAVAEKVRAAIADASLIIERKITISIGGSEYSQDKSAAEWLKECDEALYEAKNKGRNCVVMK